jgi:hypothetical protein
MSSGDEQFNPAQVDQPAESRQLLLLSLSFGASGTSPCGALFPALPFLTLPFA